MSQGGRVYTEPEIVEQLSGLPEWSYRDGAIRRSFATTGWPATMLVANAIAFASEAAGHHPDLKLGWSRIEVALHTHSAGGITEKDFETAALIERTVLWHPDSESSLDGPPTPFVW
jgi:4a-hydroxytetrahydrobiopterin dehydratase